MAFPAVASVGYSEETAVTTTHDVVVPSGIAVGNLLLLVISWSTAATGTITGWTQLSELDNGSGEGSVWYKFADGTETNFTYSTSATRTSTNRCYRVTGAHPTAPPEAATPATGTGTTPDPPSLAPSWGQADTLWIAFYSHALSTGTASAYPTNYADNQYTDGVVSGGSDNAFGIATRNLNAASDDPPAFTVGTGAWVAFTAAVRPVSDAGPLVNSLRLKSKVNSGLAA